MAATASFAGSSPAVGAKADVEVLIRGWLKVPALFRLKALHAMRWLQDGPTEVGRAQTEANWQSKVLDVADRECLA